MPLMPGPMLGPLGVGRVLRAPQSRYSLSFAAASSQYVSVPYAASLNPATTGQISFGGWLKFATVPAEHSGAVLMSKWRQTAGTTQSWLVFRSDGSVGANQGGMAFQLRQSNNTVQTVYGGTQSFTANVWYHVACTADGSNLRLYLNGTLDAAAVTYNGTIANDATTNIQLGRLRQEDTLYCLDGKLDDCFIVASALSGAQITALAAGTLDPATLSPAGLWRFEEGSGTTAADSSGNGNTGTLVNGPTWSTDVPSQLQ